MKKSYTGYKSFDYLSDRRALKYKLSKEYERVPSYLVPMTDEQEKQLAAIGIRGVVHKVQILE